MPIHSCGQSVSAPRGKAGVRLNAHTELRAKRQRLAREAIYRNRLLFIFLLDSSTLRDTSTGVRDKTAQVQAEMGMSGQAGEEHAASVHCTDTLVHYEQTVRERL